MRDSCEHPSTKPALWPSIPSARDVQREAFSNAEASFSTEAKIIPLGAGLPCQDTVGVEPAFSLYTSCSASLPEIRKGTSFHPKHLAVYYIHFWL